MQQEIVPVHSFDLNSVDNYSFFLIYIKLKFKHFT